MRLLPERICSTAPGLAKISLDAIDTLAPSCCSSFCSRFVELYLQGLVFSRQGIMFTVQRAAKPEIIDKIWHFLSFCAFFFKTTKDRLFSDVLFGGLHEDSVRKSQLNSSWQ